MKKEVYRIGLQTFRCKKRFKIWLNLPNGILGVAPRTLLDSDKGCMLIIRAIECEK